MQTVRCADHRLRPDGSKWRTQVGALLPAEADAERYYCQKCYLHGLLYDDRQHFRRRGWLPCFPDGKLLLRALYGLMWHV